jgi:hypothetical protein
MSPYLYRRNPSILLLLATLHRDLQHLHLPHAVIHLASRRLRRIEALVFKGPGIPHLALLAAVVMGEDEEA